MDWEATRLTHRDYQSFAVFHEESLNSAPAETSAVCSHVIAEIPILLMPINWVLLALNGKDQWRWAVLGVLSPKFSSWSLLNAGFHGGVPYQSTGSLWIRSSSQTDTHSAEPTRETLDQRFPATFLEPPSNPNLGKQVHVYVVKSP